MANESLPTDLLSEVDPVDAVEHATAKGWIRVSLARDDIAVFNDPDGGPNQVLVPLKATIRGYAYRSEEFIRQFADREGRPAIEVLHDLLARSADVLRFCVVVPGQDGGTLSVEDGARLYSGVRLSLLAAARSVIDPQRAYQKLDVGSASEFIKRCKLGQTERGSYIATVACPLNALPERTEDDVPFSRQTTGLLLTSMQRVAAALEAGQENELLVTKVGEHMVSANLCEAIATMQPEEDGGNVSVRCSWASSRPEADATPKEVTFHARYRKALLAFAKKLKASDPDPFVTYLAKVVGVKGEPDVVKRKLGIITVTLSDRGKVRQHVQMEVTPPDYATAGAAHVAGLGISFSARLIRGVKSARIEEYQDFKVLDHLPVLNQTELPSKPPDRSESP